MKNLAILVSGSGSNMQAIADACIAKEIDGKVEVIISSNAEAYALVRATTLGVRSRVCSLKDFDGDAVKRDREIMKILSDHKIDYVVLAGYLGILTPTFIDAYPYKIINIHPSLLPKFGGKDLYGLKVHKAVIEAGESESGATAHFVTATIDGGPIIRQDKVRVYKDDSADMLQARILEKIEHPMLVSVVRDVCADKISVVDGKVITKD